jgi:hypothetical protein
VNLTWVRFKLQDSIEFLSELRWRAKDLVYYIRLFLYISYALSILRQLCFCYNASLLDSELADALSSVNGETTL